MCYHTLLFVLTSMVKCQNYVYTEIVICTAALRATNLELLELRPLLKDVNYVPIFKVSSKLK